MGPQSHQQWLNKALVEKLNHFVMAYAKKPISKDWVDEVIDFISTFPNPGLIVNKLDVFWNHLSFNAYSNNDNRFQKQFVLFLKSYNLEHQLAELDIKIARFQSQLDQV